MPSPYADLALYDRAGRLIAIAEVKNKQGTSPEWAAKFRRNMLVHGGYSQADFFLLVTPDRLYIWKHAGSTAPFLVQPTYELDAQPLFAPYFERAGISPSDISGQAFELVVAAWLADLVRSEEKREALTNGQRILAESGFLTAVRDGRIEYEEAA
jgi:hypothetical protein